MTVVGSAEIEIIPDLSGLTKGPSEAADKAGAKLGEQLGESAGDRLVKEISDQLADSRSRLQKVADKLALNVDVDVDVDKSQGALSKLGSGVGALNEKTSKARGLFAGLTGFSLGVLFNEDLLASFGEVFSQLADSISTVVLPVLEEIKPALEPLFPVITELVGELAGPLGEVLIALAPTLVTLVQAITPLIPPFADLVALIAQIGAPVLEPIAGALAKVGEVLGGVFGSIGGIIGTVLTSVTGVFSGLGDLPGFLGDVAGTIVDFFVGLPETLLGLGGAAAEAIGELGLSLFAGLTDAAADAISGIVDGITGLPETLLGLVGGLADAGLDLGKSLIEGLLEGLGAIGEFVGDLGTEILDAITGAWNAFVDVLNSSTPNTIELPGPIPDINLPDNPWSFLKLAAGGIINPSAGGTPAILAEAGVPEAAIPLPPGVLDGLKAIGAGASASAGQTVNVTVNGADRPAATAREVILAQRRERFLIGAAR